MITSKTVDPLWAYLDYHHNSTWKGLRHISQNWGNYYASNSKYVFDSCERWFWNV